MKCINKNQRSHDFHQYWMNSMKYATSTHTHSLHEMPRINELEKCQVFWLSLRITWNGDWMKHSYQSAHSPTYNIPFNSFIACDLRFWISGEYFSLFFFLFRHVYLCMCVINPLIPLIFVLVPCPCSQFRKCCPIHREKKWEKNVAHFLLVCYESLTHFRHSCCDSIITHLCIIC